jgi:hypothetical protein
MRSSFVVLAILCALCAAGRAEPTGARVASAVAEPEASAPPRFAIGVSSPLGWLAGWFGMSAYGRLGNHFAVRVNVATYADLPGGSLGTFLSSFEGGTGYEGKLVDVGIAGVWYPRRAWDGFLIEVGGLRRARNSTVWPELEGKTTTRSTTYAVRALVGWSWPMTPHTFVAFAAGLSQGRESGRATLLDDYDSHPMTTPVDRTVVAGETYLRFGVVFSP